MIRSPDLDQALLVLPLKDALAVLGYCRTWLETDTIASTMTELICRVVMFLVRLHHGQVIAGGDRMLISSVQDLLAKRLQDSHDIVGFNLAALRFWSGELAEQNYMPFQEAAKEVNKRSKKMKKRQAPLL